MSENVEKCFHCGADCGNEIIRIDQKAFCCSGCKTVYEILNDSDMCSYYDIENTPGLSPKGKFSGKFDFLKNPEIAEKLLDFNDGEISIVNFYTPSMHCSSCIWLLENISRLNPSVISSQVDFPKKKVRISFKNTELALNELADLISSIGYEPAINLNDLDQKNAKVDRTLIYQLGIAGFAFGNIMLLALPEYFEVEEFWLDQYKGFFRYVMMILSIPVLLYSSKDYFISAFKGLRSSFINIDVPIALGILVLFIRSSYEVITDTGSGYFDSLSGLLFFLLLGKLFQDKTYKTMSFDRDYKSYFPVAVTRIRDNKEENVQVSNLNPGDKILIRNEELIPADCILLSKIASIDNSFVTGESSLVEKHQGEKIFAGGKQIGEAIELEVQKTVSQSYLTQLWNNDVFAKSKDNNFKNITDSISKYFTVFIIFLAIIAGTFWYYQQGIGVAVNVFTAILIVACPCALALSAPFTFGNVLRIFGRNSFYVKNTYTLEEMAKIKNIVFDKTGTLTESDKSEISYKGQELSQKQLSLIKNIVRQSNHPLSRLLYNNIFAVGTFDLNTYQEIAGQGIYAQYGDEEIKIGSAKFVNSQDVLELNQTRVYISFNSEIKGYFLFENKYRPKLKSFFDRLKSYNLSVLSGDNEGERSNLISLMPENSVLNFNQKPEQKLAFIKQLQDEGHKTVMIGDGLNDAGALMQSNVGISVSENINSFSPACDAILDAREFDKLPVFFEYSKIAHKIVLYSFAMSFAYNSIGLYFAVNASLSPIIAAILMPISSISVVLFVTLSTNIIARKRGLY